MVFTGYFEHAIDEKNRLAIPAKLRSRWDRERDGSGFYIVPGRPSPSLWLYTERHFERLAEATESELAPDDRQLDFDQAYYPLAEFAELDSQGRILIPDRVLRRVNFGREVVLCGVRDHIEVHGRERFVAMLDAKLERFPEIHARLRAVDNENRRQPGPEAGST